MQPNKIDTEILIAFVMILQITYSAYTSPFRRNSWTDETTNPCLQCNLVSVVDAVMIRTTSGTL